jgi:glycosyltransferase involved in cell wall biosynthesis
MSLSVAIITLNEAANIERCIRAAQTIASEIVVVDSGSSDGTQEIVRNTGATLIEQSFLGYGLQKQFAVNNTAGSWVLSLDADEVLTEPLCTAIQEAIVQENTLVFQVNRLNNYLGTWLKHSGWHPDWQTRLWKRGAAQWNDADIHEGVYSKHKVGRLRGKLLHYSIESKEQHLRTIENYTTLSAQKLKREGKEHQAFKRFVSPPFHFIQTYFFKLGFLDGVAGFWVCWRSAYATYLKYKKLKDLS